MSERNAKRDRLRVLSKLKTRRQQRWMGYIETNEVWRKRMKMLTDLMSEGIN